MILQANNTIFLCIDMQEKLLPSINNSEEVIKYNKIWFEIATVLDIPIMVTEQYPNGLGHTIQSLDLQKFEASVFEKMTFGNPTLEMKNFLEKSNRNQVIISGVETHICVFQMARDLVNLGYKVYIAKDAVGSRTKENYENGLYLLDKSGCIITNTESALFDLLKIAGTPEFKVLSKLIK
ncbi:MAG: isochorismatase family protein [Tissierellia bacterium]|nr:isochorismatase family protein [Tissierellia bacterium]